MDPTQLSKFMSTLDQMSAMISEMKKSIPGDSAEEQTETIDEATAEQVADGEEGEDAINEDTGQSPEMVDDSGGESDEQTKKLKKAAAVAMLRKSL